MDEATNIDMAFIKSLFGDLDVNGKTDKVRLVQTLGKAIGKTEQEIKNDIKNYSDKNKLIEKYLYEHKNKGERQAITEELHLRDIVENIPEHLDAKTLGKEVSLSRQKKGVYGKFKFKERMNALLRDESSNIAELAGEYASVLNFAVRQYITCKNRLPKGDPRRQEIDRCIAAHKKGFNAAISLLKKKEDKKNIFVKIHEATEVYFDRFIRSLFREEFGCNSQEEVEVRRNKHSFLDKLFKNIKSDSPELTQTYEDIFSVFDYGLDQKGSVTHSKFNGIIEGKGSYPRYAGADHKWNSKNNFGELPPHVLLECLDRLIECIELYISTYDQKHPEKEEGENSDLWEKENVFLKLLRLKALRKRVEKEYLVFHTHGESDTGEFGFVNVSLSNSDSENNQDENTFLKERAKRLLNEDLQNTIKRTKPGREVPIEKSTEAKLQKVFSGQTDADSPGSSSMANAERQRLNSIIDDQPQRDAVSSSIDFMNKSHNVLFGQSPIAPNAGSTGPEAEIRSFFLSNVEAIQSTLDRNAFAVKFLEDCESQKPAEKQSFSNKGKNPAGEEKTIKSDWDKDTTVDQNFTKSYMTLQNAKIYANIKNELETSLTANFYAFMGLSSVESIQSRIMEKVHKITDKSVSNQNANAIEVLKNLTSLSAHLRSARAANKNDAFYMFLPELMREKTVAFYVGIIEKAVKMIVKNYFTQAYHLKFDTTLEQLQDARLLLCANVSEPNNEITNMVKMLDLKIEKMKADRLDIEDVTAQEARRTNLDSEVLRIGQDNSEKWKTDRAELFESRLKELLNASVFEAFAKANGGLLMEKSVAATGFGFAVSNVPIIGGAAGAAIDSLDIMDQKKKAGQAVSNMGDPLVWLRYSQDILAPQITAALTELIADSTGEGNIETLVNICKRRMCAALAEAEDFPEDHDGRLKFFIEAIKTRTEKAEEWQDMIPLYKNDYIRANGENSSYQKAFGNMGLVEMSIDAEPNSKAAKFYYRKSKSGSPKHSHGFFHVPTTVAQELGSAFCYAVANQLPDGEKPGGSNRSMIVN